MTDEEIAAHTDAWRLAPSELPILHLPESAAGILAAVRADEAS